jgi:hypothetical protein
MSERHSTTIELVKDLREIELTHPRPAAIQRIIRRAEVGHYHDYLTDAACPKVELVNDLLAAGNCELLVGAVMSGHFDESPDDRRVPRVED